MVAKVTMASITSTITTATTTKTRFFILSCLLLLVGLTGCEEEVLPPGSISFAWMVGTQGCGSAGIDRVVVYIEGNELSDTISETYNCRAGEATVEGIPEGSYRLVFEGMDVEGNRRYGTVEENLRVSSDKDTDIGTVRLSALKADIIVTWYFENARMCAANNVSTVELTLFQNEYSINSDEVDCRMGEALFSQIEAGTYTVDAIALDETGHVLFNGQKTVTVGMGDKLQLELPLL